MRVCLPLLPLLLLTACASSQPRRDPHTIAPTTTDKALAGRTTLAMPITIAGQSTVIIPFAIESEKDLFETSDPFNASKVGRWSAASSISNSAGLTTSLAEGDYASRIRSYQGGSGGVRWHNAIVHDTRTGEEWPILDRRGIISAWHVSNQTSREHPDAYRSRAIVFLATIDDTNHDGLLNDRDARVAILTGGDGRHPRIISPVAAQVSQVVFDPDHDRVYLLVVADTNNDGRYGFNDNPVPFACELGGTAPATPIVSEQMLRRVESMVK